MLWKAYERKIAQLFNGKRVIEKGYNAEDVEHSIFSIECKTRSKKPKWLYDMITQAITNSPTDKTPIVVFHSKNDNYKNDLVVINLEDFLNFCESRGIL